MLQKYACACVRLYLHTGDFISVGQERPNKTEKQRQKKEKQKHTAQGFISYDTEQDECC